MASLENGAKLVLSASISGKGTLGGTINGGATQSGRLSIKQKLGAELSTSGRLCGILSTKGRLSGLLSGTIKYVENPNGTLGHVTVRSGSSNKLVKPPEGVYGFGAVTVEGDEDLLPENIKAGKNILGVEGTLEAEGGRLEPDFHVISNNEQYTALPDAGYYGIKNIIVDTDPTLIPNVLKIGTTAYGVEGEFGKFQPQSMTINENGSYSFTPSEGFDALSSVGIKVDVPQEKIENVVDANLTSLTIHPKRDSQTFNTQGNTGEDDIHGYNYIFVEGDDDLVSENIRKDKVIFGVKGSYELLEPNLEENKAASLTSFPLIVTPSQGKDGMKAVTVYSGDEDFDAENIKSGVSIFGVKGTYLGENIRTQYKMVTPERFPWYVFPDAPEYNGLNEVRINADSNLSSGNIRDGVTIFGVKGTYESPLQVLELIPSLGGGRYGPGEGFKGISEVVLAPINFAELGYKNLDEVRF